jgi:leucyl aminopeptidase
MQTVYKTPSVRLTDEPTRDIDVDLIVIPVFEDDDFGDDSELDTMAGGAISRARRSGEFKGKPFEVFVTELSKDSKASRAMLVGTGGRDTVTADVLRRAAATAGLAARQRRIPRIALRLRASGPVSMDDATQAMVEGVLLANFEVASYKTGEPARGWIDAVALRVPDPASVSAALARGLVLGECSNIARELANEPGNALTPSSFAERAAALARATGLEVDVLDEPRIAELKMGLLLGVSRGSHEPPRIVVIRHEPADAVDGVVLGLVGKGVTFDSGGISIKPAENMDKMKDDMSGGAAVVAAMTAIARLQAPVRCIGIVPMTENMPGGSATRPGDVLTSAEGKTVEILNTDAEGRLILGDALWYARQLGVTHLLDVATLTGACVVALGKTTSGLFGTPSTWVEQVRLATERAGDRSWPMPVFEDYKDLLKSDIADFTNTGGRAGGAITGALFVKEFAGNLPWVHMDIAGTAWAEEAKPYQPKGPTGVGVRTLAELALAARSWVKLDS